MAPLGGEVRERIEAEDFEVPPGEDFDPVTWINARLRSNGVGFDRLEVYLQGLGTSCQLKCQEMSEAIELAADQLVTQLPSTSRDLERMQSEVSRGTSQLGSVLEGLKDADDRKHAGLHGLAEIDAVKSRVETACSALREVGSWDRKVRDCEQMVHSGNLPAALTQLVSLKGVLDAFRMLPEYPRKAEQLGLLEESLLRAAQRKAKLAVERNVTADLRTCCEVFTGMQRATEPASIAEAVFRELAERTWQGKVGGTDTADLAGAAAAVFDAVAHAFEERWQMLQQVDRVPDRGSGSVADDTPQAEEGGVLVGVLRVALGVLSHELSGRLPKEARALPAATDDTGEPVASAGPPRDSQAVALLAAYVDGARAVAKSAPLAATPAYWAATCRDSGRHAVLPWQLLREIAVFVVWHPMQDGATALVPAAHAQISPSEAVLAAESNAKRFLQLAATWARRLEQQGAGQLAPVWLACVDATCATYWNRWDKLIETFQNTLKGRLQRGSAEVAFDSSLLNECMQLHSMLHDSLAAHFRQFRIEVVQHAARMGFECDSPFGVAVQEKLQGDPKAWSEQLQVPSPVALQAAHGILKGCSPESSSLPTRAAQGLPEASAALQEAEKQVRSLVTQCCVQPVLAILATYPEAREWSSMADSSEMLVAGGPNPLQPITAVGEHLFSLVPQLERLHDRAGSHWLPTILEAVTDATLQKVLQIKQLGNVGARQLAADLEYLQKVVQALGHEDQEHAPAGLEDTAATPAAEAPAKRNAAELKDYLEALEFLAKQQQRQQDCLAKGEPFSEAPREGPPLNRRFERVLRGAMALPQ